jgi:hypothetical protein
MRSIKHDNQRQTATKKIWQRGLSPWDTYSIASSSTSNHHPSEVVKSVVVVVVNSGGGEIGAMIVHAGKSNTSLCQNIHSRLIQDQNYSHGTNQV